MSPAPPLAAVLGWPIGHSRSPALHGHWLRRYGIDGHYIPIAIAPDALEYGLKALACLGFRGCNVTLPHKEAALALATEASDRARGIGSANTLTFREDGGIHADNTDAYGFIASLRQSAPAWQASTGPSLVLGAGGAARAVIAGLLAEGAPEIRLANRNRARAEDLRRQFGPRVTVVDWDAAPDSAAGTATIVNTTSLGMEGQPSLAFGFDAAPQGALVTDLVYRPLETPFLLDARRHGLATVDGVGMLLHQAVPGFERWFGRKPEVDARLRAAVLET